jgi:hypothetical protein
MPAENLTDTWHSVPGAVPDEKQGVDSAVNDTSREMGGALGIAVAGSIWPDAIPTNPHPGWRTFPPRSAGLRPIHASTIDHNGVIVSLAAILIGLWAPGRDGRQLRLVRRTLATRVVREK